MKKKFFKRKIDEQLNFSGVLVLLQSVQSEYERVSSLKNSLEKQLEERLNELKATKSVANSFTNQLKEKLEQMNHLKVKRRKLCRSIEFVFSLKIKTKAEEENADLKIQMQKLKVDLENSELVQHDFVKLSQSLQVC